MLVIPLTIIALSVILLVGAALGVVYYLTKNPPMLVLPEIVFPPINIRVDADLERLIPTPFVIQFQAIPPDRTPIGVQEEPMPVEVYNYIQGESEEHARVSRGRYARKLRSELGSWEMALEQLKREDS